MDELVARIIAEMTAIRISAEDYDRSANTIRAERMWGMWDGLDLVLDLIEDLGE